MTTTLISCIIPTYNRASYLRQAIESLISQTLPPDQYEILVVDNCSTDQTKTVVEEQLHRALNLRYVYEPVLGLNPARNTGWRCARGEYLAYTDDDAIAPPNWLAKILESFEHRHPQPGCVGGKTEPIWEAPRPGWLPDELMGMLTIFGGSTSGVLSPSEFLVGANMAFRKSTLESVGGFHPWLDRVGNRLTSLGDTFIQIELEKRGIARFYDPAIHINHHVPIGRLKQRWFLSRSYWQGVSAGIAELHVKSLSRWEAARLAFHRSRIFAASWDRVRAFGSRTQEPCVFLSKCRAYEEIGNICGLLGKS